MPHHDPERRTEIARKAGQARAAAARRRAEQRGKAIGPFEPPTAAPAAAPGQLMTLDEHDGHLGRPVSWPDALKRLQVPEQALINARREVELEAARVALSRAKTEADEASGKLVPRVELDRAVALIRDAWWKSAQQITSDVLAALPGLPIEARELINRACGDAVSKAALRVKADLSQ